MPTWRSPAIHRRVAAILLFSEEPALPVTADPVPGYTAPPLDGIWATGPFLHNGSVPNLALVLDSTRRPTYWRRVDFDSTNFEIAGMRVAPPTRMIGR